MRENISRRDLLKVGAVGLGVPAFAGESLANQTENSRLADSTSMNTLRIETYEGGPLVSYEFVVSGGVAKGPEADANDSSTDLGSRTRVTGEVGNGYADDFYVEGQVVSWSANVHSDHYRVLFNGTPINVGDGPSNTLTIETFEGGPLVNYEFVVGGLVEKGPTSDANDSMADLGAQTRVTGEVGNGYTDNFYVESRPSDWSANVNSDHYRVLFNGTPINVDGGPNNTLTIETFEGGPLVSYEFVVNGDVDTGPESDANDNIINLGSEMRVTGEVGNGYADDFYVENRPTMWSANVDDSHYRVLYNGTPIGPAPDITVETVSASPKSDTPRYVTFTGRFTGVPDGVSAVVGFEYQDYNAMWGETDTTEITANGMTEFSITEKMPYIGRSFSYRAIVQVEGQSSVGDKQQVKVPNFIDTVEVETDDVSVSGTTATVYGRIADFGKATTLEASAKATSGSFSDTQGVQSYFSTESKQVSDGGPNDFYIQYHNLDPNTDYEARTLAKIPAGPVPVKTHGDVVEFTTGN